MSLTPKIPIQRLENEITKAHKIALYVERLDTIDLYAGGNKFFKLKYNVEEAKKQGKRQLLTFGGAWSNHLAAAAKACKEEKIGLICVIRGEEPAEYSETLRYCKENGAQFYFVSREDYRRKTEEDFIQELHNKFGDFYLLPEGGSNALAEKGCKEIVDLIDIKFDLICCPIGSGGTFAGIVSGLKDHQETLGFVALKGGEYMSEIISDLVESGSPQGGTVQKSKLVHDYHFGGFAKTSHELIEFKKDFEKEFGFELDYIYTAKMFYGIFDLIKKNYFKEGSTIVAVHTGGLQGNKGFESK